MSREFWSKILGGNNGKIGTEMVLLKLGSNITSLREFTALCQMDSIPLLDYILGGKMNSKTCNVALSGSVANDLDDDEDDDEDNDTDPSTKQSFPAWEDPLPSVRDSPRTPLKSSICHSWARYRLARTSMEREGLH